MLLGELVDKCDVLRDNIDLCIKSVSKGEVDGENVSLLIKSSFSDIEKYYNYYHTMLNTTNSIKVDRGEGKSITLNQAFILRDILVKKIEFLDKIIVDNNYNIDLKDVLSIKNDLLDNLYYTNSLINKTIWSTEIDVKGIS